MIAGGAVLGATLIAPHAVESAYGTAKIAATDSIDTFREDTFGELPTVQLGITGGIPELDACDGTFTHMSSYESDTSTSAAADVPPVWAAHNNCLGDVVLSWDVGQHLRIEGDPQVYEVVDVTHTTKIWATTADLEGLEGTLALQSCFYGEDRMKFVGLAPVA